MRTSIAIVALAALIAWLPQARAAAQTAGPPAAGQTLGVWCDVTGTFVSSMTIRADDAGRPSLRRTFPRGDPLVQRLRFRNGAYWIVDGVNGDRQRMLANGDLQLIDNDGPIRVARRVASERACLSR